MAAAAFAGCASDPVVTMVKFGPMTGFERIRAARARDASRDASDARIYREEIQNLIFDMLTAIEAQDIDAMISFSGEGFSPDSGLIEATKEFMVGAKDQGGLTRDLRNTRITFHRDSATAAPVELKAAFSALTLAFELTKQGGQWKITSLQQF